MKTNSQRRQARSCDDQGYRRMVAEMLMGAIIDLSVLRRNGMWWDDPAEVAETLRTAQNDKGQRDPGRLLRCQGSLVHVGVTTREYLQGLCKVAWGALGVTMSPGQVIEAAKRHGDECNYVRMHGKRNLERRREAV